MDYRPDNSQDFSSVTQCPYCHTAFHVGLAQLDAAAGRVRCGGCLRVFNAKEHFLVEQRRLFDDEPGMEAEDETFAPEPEKSEDSFSSLDLDLFGEEIPDDDEPVILGSFNHYSGISIPRRAILENKVDAFRQEDYEHASAEEVLGDHEHLLEPEDEALPEDESPEYISLSTADHEADTDFLEISTADSFEDFTDTGDIRASDEEFAETEVSSAELQQTADEYGNEEHAEDDRQDDTEKPAATQTFESEAIVEPEAPADDFFIRHPAKNPGKSATTWWVALVLATLALPVQLLFIQPDSLVIKSWFRQVGAVICPRIGCPVPEYSAPDLIRISGFIEPHPEYSNSLVAKIDLRNQGLAEQPFPPIAIYFRNLDGQVTASRVFQPDEYIQGEARGYRNMPVNRNVQLELELLDPGERSTSYELYIAPTNG